MSTPPIPNLLAVLVELLEDHRRLDPHHHDICPTCQRAEAVLAQVRGEVVRGPAPVNGVGTCGQAAHSGIGLHLPDRDCLGWTPLRHEAPQKPSATVYVPAIPPCPRCQRPIDDGAAVARDNEQRLVHAYECPQTGGPATAEACPRCLTFHPPGELLDSSRLCLGCAMERGEGTRHG